MSGSAACGKGLQAKLDQDTFYKENTGKTFDLSNCKVEEGQARCDTVVSAANDCLEKLHSSEGKIPDSCEIEQVPEDRPLLTETKYGTLVAQRSSTALVAEYRDRAIESEPFIVSNSDSLGITYGTEQITIQGKIGATDTVVFPKGNFTAMNVLYQSNQWQRQWISLAPRNLRQVLVFVCIAIQALILVPALISLSDIIAHSCGIDLMPCVERGMLLRYRPRQVPTPEELEMDSYDDNDPSALSSNRTSRSVSRNSDISRIRIQNQRALNRLF